MKKSFSLIFVVCMLFPLTQCDRAKSHSDISKLKCGIYLRIDYLDSLEKYRSPRLATEGKELLGVTIERIGNNKNNAMLILNFHEGIRLNELDQDSRSKLNIRINSPTSLIINNPYNEKEHDLKFVFVAEGDDYEQAISFLVLGGQYRDKDGNKYQFGKNGNVIFPEGVRKYQVLIDFIGPPGQDNVKLGESEYYYEYRDGILKLFKMHFDYNKGEEVKPRELNPSFVFHKME